MENRKFDKNDLATIIVKLTQRLNELKYNGDIGDVGNEIGFIVGEHYSNFDDEDIDEFVSGFKHGISLTNGTH